MERAKYLATAAVLAGLPLLALLWNRQSKSRPPYPPGPRPEPIIAHLRSFPKRRWYETFSEWSKTYGDVICLRVIGKTFVIINGLDAARELLVKRGHIHSGRQQTVMLNVVIGRDWNFIAMNPGPFHSECRTIFRKAIGPQEASVHDGLIQQEYCSLLDTLRDFQGDPWLLLHSAIGAIVIKITYGNSIYEQLGKELVKLNHDMLKMVGSIGYSFWLVNFIPWLHYLPDWMPLAFKKVGKTGRKLQERMHFWAWEETVKHYQAGIAEKSIALEYLERQENLEVVRDALAMMYSAGVENTAKTLFIFLSTMLIHPNVQRRVHEEIDQEIASGSFPTSDDRSKLPYLDAAWRESRRLNPSTPLGISHLALQEDVYDGMYIPQGSILIANMGFMCRDPRIFDKPDEYLPERWLPEYNPSASSLPDDIGFGFGRRVCPGQYLADRMGFAFAAAILAAYNIIPVPGEEIPKSFIYEDAGIRGPLDFRCRFEPRPRA